jgi:hypothetical protein
VPDRLEETSPTSPSSFSLPEGFFLLGVQDSSMVSKTAQTKEAISSGRQESLKVCGMRRE